VPDEVKPEAGELALGSHGRGGKPDRRHEISPRELSENVGIDPVGLAGERREALPLLCVGDLDRPAVQLEGVVDKACTVHRLDDREHLVAGMIALHAAHEATQPVEIRRCGRHLDLAAVLREDADVETMS
jgi:hypothetical protein